jgi:hypothetical protein
MSDAVAISLKRPFLATGAGMVCESTRTPPADVRDADVDLFRSPAFFALHRFSTTQARYLTIRRADGTVWGAGWMAETMPGIWRSPVRGPYGFVQPLGPKHRLPEFDGAVAAVGDALTALGARHADIVLPPAAHDPDADALWQSALVRHGWSPRVPELNFALAVTAEDVERRMNDGNRETVRRAERKELAVRALSPVEFADAFEVIAQNRRRRGRPFTMTFEAFTQMHEAMPGRLLWHGVFHAGVMIAASIAMVLSPTVLYVSYWGERDGAERQSPVTLLAHALYAEAQARGIALLDIGIATEGGVPNAGLVQYKRNIGCTASLRAAFSRTWSAA